jgi:hypothetical protein
MSTNITHKAAAVQAEVEKWQSHAKACEERLRTKHVVFGAVLTAAVGKDAALAFYSQKLDTLNPGECRFYGPDGVEAVRHPEAGQIETGWSMAADGAAWAIKSTAPDGSTLVTSFEPAALAVVINEMATALAQYQNAEGSLYRTIGDAAEDYTKCLEEMARDHLDLSGETQRIYREAKAAAEIEIRAKTMAAQAIADEKAEKKVEAVVRKLAAAAAMPAGLERAMLLEETAPMVRKAFGAE